MSELENLPVAPLEAPAASLPPPPAPAASRPGVFEWLTLGHALAAARGRITSRPLATSVRLERAQAAAELAARALDPVTPIRRGNGNASAVTLARESAFWALAAWMPDESPATLGAAIDMADPARVAFAAGGEQRLAWFRSSLVDRTFIEIAQLSVDDQRQLADEALRFTAALVDELERPAREVSMIRAQRWVRFVISVGVVALLAFGAVRGVDRLRLGTDLASGKPTRTSSAYGGFSLESHTCDTNDTKILFHTNEEQNPWYEIDLGAPTSIKAVEIRNRTDGFGERAVPLAVEVSDDRNAWTEIGQRTTNFETWRLTIPPRTNRYVRVRALKRTWLHLERVSVYGRK
jgi:hypothetical protein